MIAKKISLILAMAMAAMAAFSFNAVPAQAETIINETEENYNEDYANPFNVGETMRGVIEDKDDVDYFSIVAPDTGRMFIKFRHPKGSDDSTWYVKIMDPEYDLKTVAFDGIEIKSDEVYSFPFIGLKKGKKLFIRVETDAENTGASCIGKQYEIATSFEKGQYYDQEPNGSYIGVDYNELYSLKIPPQQVLTDTEYTGILTYNDIDCYEFTAPETGVVDVRFDAYTDSTFDPEKDYYCVHAYEYTDGGYRYLLYQNLSINGASSGCRIYADKGCRYLVTIDGHTRKCEGHPYTLNLVYIDDPRNYDVGPGENITGDNVVIIDPQTGLPVNDPGSDMFPDVSDPDMPCYDPVYWAVERGIVKGYDNGLFGPEDTCTREQFVIMLWRMAGKPDAGAQVGFGDITSSRSSYKAIRWAVEKGIIAGYDDGTFRPTDKVTRRQVCIMLWRWQGRPSASKPAGFSDMKTSESTYKAIQWGAEAGIIKGYSDGTFRPENDCQRQHIVIFLYRVAKL